MAISLEAFHKIANGTENVGEIRLNATGTGLEKINNHVYKTSKNNVRLTTEQNRQVRQALLNAFRDSNVDSDVFFELEHQLLGNGRDEYALSRDYVRHLIAATRTKTGNRLENVKRMETIDYALRNRKPVDNETLAEFSQERLVKSRKDVAYSLTINETVDRDVQIARAALAGKSSHEIIESKRLTKNIHLATNMICKTAHAVNSMLAADPEIDDVTRENVASKLKTSALLNDRETIYLAQLTTQGENVDEKLNAHIERKIRLIFMNAKINSQTTDKHLGRLFKNPTHTYFNTDLLKYWIPKEMATKMTVDDIIQKYNERLARLKYAFFRVGQGLIANLDEIRKVRNEFLDFLKDEIKIASYLPDQNSLLDKLEGIANHWEKHDVMKSNWLDFERSIKDFSWNEDPATSARELESLLKKYLNLLLEDQQMKAGTNGNEAEPNIEVIRFKTDVLQRLSLLGLGV